MRLPGLSGISPISFYGSAAISLGLILFASIAPEAAASLFRGANDWIVAEAGWFYMLAVGGFVIFLLWLALSGFGNIKLGPDEAVPRGNKPLAGNAKKAGHDPAFRCLAAWLPQQCLETCSNLLPRSSDPSCSRSLFQRGRQYIRDLPRPSV